MFGGSLYCISIYEVNILFLIFSNEKDSIKKAKKQNHLKFHNHNVGFE